MDNFQRGLYGLGMSTHVLHDLVDSFPEAAHIKDTTVKKYIHSNKNNLKIYGLNDPEKIIGLTVHDLDEFMNPYWGKGFADKISDLDDYVINEAKVITDKNRIFLDKFGLVHVQNMTKAPITNTSNKVTAILTMSFEVTEKLSKFKIFSMYKKIYLKKKKFCLCFMQHLKIKDFFIDLLSEKEIICLLHRLDNKSNKYIAEKMNIAVKTVETHINNIGLKTKSYDLVSILNFLKNLEC